MDVLTLQRPWQGHLLVKQRAARHVRMQKPPLLCSHCPSGIKCPRVKSSIRTSGKNFTMRVFALFLSTFLLLITTGTLTYIYLLRDIYWIREAELKQEETTTVQQSPLPDTYLAMEPGTVRGSDRDTGITTAKTPPSPAPPTETSEEFGKRIIRKLQTKLEELGKRVLKGDVQDAYEVNDAGRHRTLSSEAHTKTPVELVCSAGKSIDIATFRRGDPFFRKKHLDQYFSKQSLSLLDPESRFATCGVVTSAGALLQSNLGKHIDKNDFVIRFNHAPTDGFEQHVGSKTSLRIINSQVVERPKYRFLDESDSLRTPKLFAKSPVLVWDTSSYNATVEQWYNHPDSPFFLPFFLKRFMRPEEELHLLKPSSLWSIWDWLQSLNTLPILPTPPSSGFIGLVLAMLNCDLVHVYEFVPSMRLTKRCHYFESMMLTGCTIDEWHSIVNEKLLAFAMNIGNASQVFQDGYITIPGFRGIQCPAPSLP